MNDNYYWFLSTIVQTIGAIWAIFTTLSLAFKDRLLGIWSTGKWHDKPVSYLGKLSNWLKNGENYFKTLNLFLALTVLCGILGLYTKHMFLFHLTFILSFMTLLLLFIYFSQLIYFVWGGKVETEKVDKMLEEAERRAKESKK